MPVRGIRGAITVEANTPVAIRRATRTLLREIVARNSLNVADIASAYFSTTRDLNAEFPAVAARQLGWHETPLICGHEMDVPGALPMCIRVLLHVNTDKAPGEIAHVYLGGATSLRSAPPPLEEDE
ncbi:MAG: chorismate mutase [Dehalococcoidia bacterium]|nr:chorismate mutase [Dehalococcoidia bacterium]